MTTPRKCTNCGVVNDGKNFHKGSPAKDGYHSRCKNCRNNRIVKNKVRHSLDKSVTKKTCSRCHINQPSENFHLNDSEKDGRQRLCKTCRSAERKKYYTKEYRASLYSISVESLNEMLSFGCMICRSHEKLVVDHDHSCCDRQNYSCGECVRGVLCSRCNIGIAHFKDSPDLLNKAKKYIKRRKNKW